MRRARFEARKRSLPMAGLIPSRPRFSVEHGRLFSSLSHKGGGRRNRAAAIAATVLGGISWAGADVALRPYTVVGDAIPASLTGAPGDPVRGKTIAVSRQTGSCLLCHSAPLPEEKFQGTIGPDLKGVGLRNTEGQLRLRIVDSRRLNPDSIMPSYYRVDGLTRVAANFAGKPILTAEQIEEVVAFLTTLRD